MVESCIGGMCLDNPKNTKVVVGSQQLKLDELDDMVERDPRMKERMKKIDEELKKY